VNDARRRPEHAAPEREEVRLTSFRRDLNRVCWAVDMSEWRSGAGTTDRDVMREFIAVAELRGTLVFGMNLRSIAGPMNVSVSTVWQATRRLKAKGFLKVGRADRLPEGSTTWHLCCPPKWSRIEQRTTVRQPSLAERHCSGMRNSQLDITVAADVFAGPGGKTRHRVWAAVQRGPSTVANLARSTALSRSSVRRILRLLEQVGLAVREGKVWRAGDADLDQAAEVLGTAGTGERRRRRFQQERAGFRAGLKRARDRQLEVDAETGEVLALPTALREHCRGLVAYAERLFRAGVIEIRRVHPTGPDAASPTTAG